MRQKYQNRKIVVHVEKRFPAVFLRVLGKIFTPWVSGSIRNGVSTVETQWMTAVEAAEYLKVQPRTILKWAKAGTIPAHALSGCQRVTWRFLKSELDGAMLKPPSAAGLGGSIEQQN
jgi:excisionase family DNA binding protein